MEISLLVPHQVVKNLLGGLKSLVSIPTFTFPDPTPQNCCEEESHVGWLEQTGGKAEYESD